MTNNEKIIMFGNYMRDKHMDESTVAFNCRVVEMLLSNVLVYFNQNLESIDSYSFEEFTDMITLIDEELGGRNGIPKLMSAMQELTEFLKKYKLIKGGKIAYYKRMFSNCDYYLDKYDMMTGKKDNSKEFIKDITQNKFSNTILNLVDDINVYKFNVINIVDKILNDVPFSECDDKDEVEFIKNILEDLNLIEEKYGQIDITKKGRMLSRLSADERYAGLIDLMFHHVNWSNVLKFYIKKEEYIEFSEVNDILTSIFYRERSVAIDLQYERNIKEEEYLIEIADPKFRIAKIESIICGSKLLSICFAGMGLIDINYEDNKIIYSSTELGQNIFKLAINQCKLNIKNKIDVISYLLKNKNYEKAETKIIEFLSTYGGNTMIWNYLGQILMLKRDYKKAYVVLKHGYEKSTKKSKASKSTLYHLVLCCRKLKLENDIKNYEKKLQSIEKV